METAALELLKASPIAIAMIILVRIFLGALEKRDERFKELSGEFSKVVDRNTTALIEFEAASAICKYKGEQKT
jgi:TfoX/Sxy family transcriptional regulator of competence genes